MSELVGTCSKHGEWNADLVARCPRCDPAASRANNVRQELWARVYAAEYGVARLQPGVALSGAASWAVKAADAAVRDFDEHFGGKG